MLFFKQFIIALLVGITSFNSFSQSDSTNTDSDDDVVDYYDDPDVNYKRKKESIFHRSEIGLQYWQTFNGTQLNVSGGLLVNLMVAKNVHFRYGFRVSPGSNDFYSFHMDRPWADGGVLIPLLFINPDLFAIGLLYMLVPKGVSYSVPIKETLKLTAYCDPLGVDWVRKDNFGNEYSRARRFNSGEVGLEASVSLGKYGDTFKRFTLTGGIGLKWFYSRPEIHYLNNFSLNYLLNL